jgi:16S rRNA (cytosine967-C5)-methyltransferase
MTRPERRPGERRPVRDSGRDDRGRGDPRARWGAVDAARQAAYEAISAVHRDDAYANLVLPAVLREMGLRGRDAAFATELTYGTLRTGDTIDAIIAIAADRALDRIDAPALDAVRLGVYQLLFTRVPAHAAVSSTVDLVRASTGTSAAGFANAVMRQIGTRDLDDWLDAVAPDPVVDRLGYLAVTRYHPLWIVRAFADALGGDLDETDRLLAEDNERPTVTLCARPGLVDALDLADSTGGAPGAFSPYAVYLHSGAPGDIPEIVQRKAHVQDEGSQLVALALAVAPLSGTDGSDGADGGNGAGGARDSHWLDLCAGPGGKAALLGALAAERGATVTAVEIAPHRADLVRSTCEGLPVDVVNADGRDVGVHESLPEGAFDRVLVDAPCTGLGALRRRPEARWRRTPADLPPLTRLQRELLGAALRAVRPGGVVGYVTCSPHLVETQVTVTEAARRTGFPVEFVDARALLPDGMPGLGTGPSIQLWPHRHGTDAMFVAVLRRVAAADPPAGSTTEKGRQRRGAAGDESADGPAE